MSVRAATITQSEEVWDTLEPGEARSALTAIGTRPTAITAPVGTHTTQTWVLPPSDTARWDGHGELLTVALLTVHDTYGPGVIIMTWPPYTVGSNHSADMAKILNDGARQQWSAVGAVGTWVVDPVQPGLAVRTTLPAAVCQTGNAGGLEAMVVEVALAHAQQCSDLAAVATGLLPDLEGPDPYVSPTVEVKAVNLETFGRPNQSNQPSGAAPAPEATRTRRLPDGMIESYIETLVERLTGVDKAYHDADGDYPIRYRRALYYVRVVHAGDPVVQFFSIALVDVDLTEKLALDINDISSRIRFCRAFWVNGQVLIESEHLALSLDEDDFRACTDAVARATDEHAPLLARHHGGRMAFEEAKDPEYTPPDEPLTGLYL